jgi:hypothetical protein
MASNILLAESVLNWLSPFELMSLKQLNREHRDVITKEQQEKKKLVVLLDKDKGWRDYARLWDQHPAVTHLSVPLDWRSDINLYLRPTLEYLTLHIQVAYGYSDWSEGLYIVNNDEICNQINKVGIFLAQNPDAALSSFCIEVDPVTKLHLELRDRVFVGYDRDGPMYEDMHWTTKTDSIPPLQYRSILSSEEDDIRIGSLVERLRDTKQWKEFSIPDQFFGTPFPMEAEENAWNNLEVLLDR